MSQSLTPDDPRLSYFNAAGRRADGPGLLLARMPVQWLARMTEPIANLAEMAAGVELRLRTDAAAVTLTLTSQTDRPQFTEFVECRVTGLTGGPAVCTESALANTGRPERITLNAFGAIPRRMRMWRILLPYRVKVRLIEIAPNAGASVEPTQAEPPARWRLLCYGDSITQGADASRPSRSYVFALSERLEVPAINMGFSGQGFAGPQETAYFLSRDDWNAMTIAIGTNSAGQAKAPSATLAQDYARMLRTIRATRPDAPIVCLSPLWRGLDQDGQLNALGEPMRAYRDAVERTVTDAIAAGDDRLHLVRGLEVIGPATGQAMMDDRLHPNDAGMARMAECLAPVLRAAMGMASP